MSHRLEFRPPAREEFDEGVDYLDRVRPGLGETMADRVWATLGLMAANPGVGTEVAPNTRKQTVPKTQYCVYYSFDDEVIDIISVFHSARDPETWRSRVE